MSWLEALILGVIQGLTEFLPVSSSGHLEIGNVLLGTRNEENLLFAIFVHAATAISTIIVFRKDLSALFSELFKFQWNESWEFSMKILISMVPVGVVGVLFEEEIESFFSGNLMLVGSALLFTGLLLIFTYYKKQNNRSVGYLDAIVIGLAQAFAIIPGISRSGSTIATALILGVEKSKATRFSFLMVLLPILGASLLKTKDFMAGEAVANISTVALTVGFLAALGTGYVACRWMLNIVRQGKLNYFAYYCWVVGLIAILSQIL